MNDPIVIWPPGTYNYDCWTESGGTYYDCSYDYPHLMNSGAVVCCPV